MEEREYVGHRKATALALVAGLAEVVLQLGRVGHRKARAVEQPGAVAAPAAGGLLLAEEGIDDALEEPLEEGQRQAAACLDVGGGGKGASGQVGQRGAGGVAMQDLQEEDVERGHGIELASPKGDAEGSTGLFDPIGGQGFGDIGLELANDFGETQSHPWPPGRMTRFVSSLHSDQRPRFFPDHSGVRG